MANGIEDLTSIMTQGGRDDIPQPMMGGGLGAMMPPQTPPMSPPDMGGMSPDMIRAEQMPMEEEPISIEQDAGALAEAVVGRAQGDIGAAVAILDTAKAMLIQSTQQDPMMMADGGPMYARGGKYMKPKYAAEGEYLGEESDTLRQMIMDRIQNSPITSMADVTRGQGMILNEGDLLGMGRTMSDAERSAIREAIGMQSGRELTQKDLDFLKEMMNSRREGTFDPEADNLRLDMGLDAEYYNMLEDERKRKEASERAKAYRSR